MARLGVFVLVALLSAACVSSPAEQERALKRGADLYIAQDYTGAMQVFRPLAEQGNAKARHMVGYLYENGMGVSSDLAEAARWYGLAADQGDAESQFALGYMHHYGRGVPQDYQAAARLYRAAAESGYALAQANYGFLLALGRGVPRDDREAVRQFQLSAAQGEAQGRNNLGTMLRDGRGVARNDAEALRLYRLAAGQGYALALNNLGQMLEAGRGAAPDRAEALRLYRLAAEKGEAAARANLQRLQTTTAQQTSGNSEVQLKRSAGTLTVAALINGALTLDFTLDSGASDVSVPADVLLTLMRTGTVREEDFLGQRSYRLADGTVVPSHTFRIRSLRVGERVVLNVTASVSDVRGPLLLGQSFLGRFRSWSVDNQRQMLLLSEQ